MNMIPPKPGRRRPWAVLPHLNGKRDGFSIRVPTINVSIVDLSFIRKRTTTVDEVTTLRSRHPNRPQGHPRIQQGSCARFLLAARL